MEVEIRMNKPIRILITVIITILTLIPMFFIRLRIYNWIFTKFIKFIPRFLWMPIDIVFAVFCYILIAYSIYFVLGEIFKSNDMED